MNTQTEALTRLVCWARAQAGDINYTGDHPIALAEAALEATAEPAAVPARRSISRLLDLISDYWEIAYKEGAEGRSHDTPDGVAGHKWDELRAEARALASHGTQKAAAAVPACNAEFGDPHKPMDETELQEFCIALSFEQDDYTVDVIRAVEDRMMAKPLFVPSAIALAQHAGADEQS